MLHERISVPSTDGFSLPLDIYCPEVSADIDPNIQRPAVVICPGGAYQFLSPREAEPVALTFAAMGFNAFIAWYRVAPHRYPRPQQDAAAAVAWVRANATKTHTHPEKIAIMGFSAGGHCAASLGVWWPRAELWQKLNLTPQQVKPNALVLSYPVITGGEKAHRGSFVNLSGSQDLKEHMRYALETQVTAQTPPAFLWHTWTDESVPVENSLLFASALKANGVQAEVHLFPFGNHGASLCNPQTSGTLNPQFVLPDCAQWPRMAADFLHRVLD